MFSLHLLLKPIMKDFQCNLGRKQNKCNYMVVWTVFGIVLLWYWNENWPFPVLWPLLTFQICWYIVCSTLIVSPFRLLNSSDGIPSLPLVLLTVMLPKAHFTSHYRTSASRWLNAPLWLFQSVRLKKKKKKVVLFLAYNYVNRIHGVAKSWTRLCNWTELNWICRVHHEKRWNGRNKSWNQDCQKKYQ